MFSKLGTPMFTIHNNRDLKDAYIFMSLLEEAGRYEETIKEMKKAIRLYLNRPREERYIVKDYGIDGYVERYPAPAECETLEDVDEWFMETQWIHMIPSQYDCTGQLFTSWYKPAYLNGRWFVYHSVSCDC